MKTLAVAATFLCALSNLASAHDLNSPTIGQLYDNAGVLERHDSAAGTVDVVTTARNGINYKQGVDRTFLIHGKAAHLISRDMIEKGVAFTDDILDRAEFQKIKAEVECSRSQTEPLVCIINLKK